MSSSIQNVADRYMSKQAAPWLPDFLGEALPVVKQAQNAIKGLLRSSYDDHKSATGTVTFYMLERAHLAREGDSYWKLLDRAYAIGGIDPMQSMGVARQITDAVYNVTSDLEGTPYETAYEDLVKVRIAGMAVRLLELGRLKRVAQAANSMLASKLMSEIQTIEGVDLGTPGPEKKPSDIFMEWVSPRLTNAAKNVVRMLGKDPGKVGAFALAVLEDVNDRRGSKAVEGQLPVDPEYTFTEKESRMVGEVSAGLDYTIEAAHAFLYALMEAVGQKGAAQKAMKALLRTYPDWYDPNIVMAAQRVAAQYLGITPSRHAGFWDKVKEKVKDVADAAIGNDVVHISDALKAGDERYKKLFPDIDPEKADDAAKLVSLMEGEKGSKARALYKEDKANPPAWKKPKDKSKGEGASGSYDDYLAKKKQEGGKPMGKEEWEKRYKSAVQPLRMQPDYGEEEG